jgi:uncharacterized protein YbaP (TraB family)
LNSETKDANVSSGEILDIYLDLWQAGDVEKFKNLVTAQDDQSMDIGLSGTEKAYMDEYNNKLVKQRDKGMAEYIDNLLKAEGNNTYFVIVGSAHYISDYSVLDILKDKGYEITQIK